MRNLRSIIMKQLSLLTVAVLVGTGVLSQDVAKAESPADELGWQLAIHAYTFRKFSIFECIDKTAALGLKYMSLSGSVSLDGTQHGHNRRPLRQAGRRRSKKQWQPKALSW